MVMWSRSAEFLEANEAELQASWPTSVALAGLAGYRVKPQEHQHRDNKNNS